MIGQIVYHYKILERLGEGRTCSVYKAQDVNLERQVVLKFLRRELLLDETEKAKFLREAKVVASLEHRNIASFYALEQSEDGQPFIVMASYDGESLKEKMTRGAFPLGEVADLTTQIAEGLCEVHKRDIIHRNLKPENVFITVDGIAKIMDFGLAKLRASTSHSRTRSIVGSPAYMSPEQLRGEKVDHRTDIWSLGVLMYAMTTGRRPFEAQFMEELVYKIVQGDLPLMSESRPDVPPKWERVVRKALAKNVFERYQNLDEFLRDFREVTAPSDQPARAEGKSRITSQGRLAMAYVLFMDIVGYSKLTMDQQTGLVKELNEIVRTTEPFLASKQADNLVILPTGDGMALVFFDDPMAPVECAVQVSRLLQTRAHLKLRMGVHSGPVFRTVDINEARNVAGSGINLAQRVMDFGDAGHILVSKSYADFLGQLDAWREKIHDLREVKVKHGVPIHIFNLYGEDFGNKEPPGKLQASESVAAPMPDPQFTATRVMAPEPRLEPNRSMAPLVAVAASAAAALAIILALLGQWQENPVISAAVTLSGLATGYLVARKMRPTSVGRVYIEIIDGPKTGMKFPLNREVIRLGSIMGERDEQNDIVVADSERLISRFHCEIRRLGSQYFLIDKGSANGTYLDGQKIEPQKPVPLKPGAQVDLARHCTIRVVLEG